MITYASLDVVVKIYYCGVLNEKCQNDSCGFVMASVIKMVVVYCTCTQYFIIVTCSHCMRICCHSSCNIGVMKAKKCLSFPHPFFLPTLVNYSHSGNNNRHRASQLDGIAETSPDCTLCHQTCLLCHNVGILHGC